MLKTSNRTESLPEIPAKRYFAIGEVSELCNVKPHVLRYWEQEFAMLDPVKRRGNRRYYQQQDVLMVRKIRNLLYDQGFTISGARAQLVLEIKKGDEKIVSTPLPDKTLGKIIRELEEILVLFDA